MFLCSTFHHAIVADSLRSHMSTSNTEDNHRCSESPCQFSTKSVVLRTPMIELVEEKLEASPPPLDSWMSTMKIISNEARTIKTTNNV